MSTGPNPSRTIPEGDRATKARSAIRGGVFAYFVDQFDIYLPAVVLVPAAIYFQPPDTSPETAAMLTALVFASTLVARPIGSAIFGHFADTVGRKRSTLVAVAGFGITTALMAILPGHTTIGLWSIGLLIALRFVGGIFLGGEYTTAIPLAMEWSPKRHRGVISGLVTGQAFLAYSVSALLTLGLLQIIPAGSLDSPYVQWGWRIPFVIGALLAAALFVFYLRAVEEPPTSRTPTTTRSPLLELVAGPHRGALLQVFVLMTGAWIAANMTTAVLPGLLGSRLQLSGTQTALVMMVLTAVVAVSCPFFGLLSQRIGRRRFFAGYGVVMLVVAAGAYALLVSQTQNLGVVIVLAVVVGLATFGVYGPIVAYLTERFPSAVRASGYGVGYSLALILPGFYAFYLRGLGEIVPAHLAPVLLIALGGVLVTVGGLVGPETKDVDMTDDRPG
jgi:MFS family permease